MANSATKIRFVLSAILPCIIWGCTENRHQPGQSAETFDVGTSLFKHLMPPVFSKTLAWDTESFTGVARHGNLDEVRRYIRLKAPINAIDTEHPEVKRQRMLNESVGVVWRFAFFRHFAPLHAACWGGHARVVKVLLDAGAQVDLRDSAGMTPLHLASSKGFSGIASILIAKGAGINATTSEGLTPLFLAAEGNHADMTKLLLREGADPQLKTKHGMTPLHVAGSGRIVNMLIEAGADLKEKARGGLTALHWQAFNGNISSTQGLLERGAGANAVDEIGCTALHGAGTAAIAQLLLKSGASASALDHRDRTPLHYAARMGKVGVARVLVKAGARIHAMDLGNSSPLATAVVVARPTTAAFLLGTAPVGATDWVSIDSLLHLSVTPVGTRAAMVRPGLRSSVDMHAQRMSRSWGGDVALAERARLVLRLLLQFGAKIDARDSFGSTALHRAAEFQELILVQELLNLGAAIDIRDKEGRTPLLLVIAQSETDHLPVVPLLLANGADRNVRDKKGRRPMDYAVERGRKSVVKLLETATDPAMIAIPVTSTDGCGRTR